MAEVLIIQEPQKSCIQRFCDEFIFALKITALILLTYGLMIGSFALWLTVQTYKGSIAKTYIDAGGILLGLFVADRIFWGLLWVWGARKREGLRRTIVERQLQQIRGQQKIQQEKDLQQQRIMIQSKRRKQGRM